MLQHCADPAQHLTFRMCRCLVLNIVMKLCPQQFDRTARLHSYSYIPGMTSLLDCTAPHALFLSACKLNCIKHTTYCTHKQLKQPLLSSSSKSAHLAIRRQVLVRPIQTHCQVVIVVSPDKNMSKLGGGVATLLMMLQYSGCVPVLSSCCHTSSSAKYHQRMPCCKGYLSARKTVAQGLLEKVPSKASVTVTASATDFTGRG